MIAKVEVPPLFGDDLSFNLILNVMFTLMISMIECPCKQSCTAQPEHKLTYAIHFLWLQVSFQANQLFL